VSHDDAEGIVLGAHVAHPPGTDVPFARVNQTISIEAVRSINGKQEIIKQTFIVRGILTEYGQTLMPVDTAVFTTLDAAGALLGTSTYTLMFITTRSSAEVDHVAAQLEEMFGNDFEIKTMAYFTESVQDLPITIFMGSIAAVALIVAGTSIANIMFVSVMERTREIGVLKALGATHGNILWLFFSEALLTGLIGGVFGCGTGFLFGYGITGFLSSVETSFNTPIFTVSIMGFAVGFAILVASLAGFYPSWQASNKHPIEALRSE
jgi:putative ABC transport system permease protein